ncbi:MAG TPA: glycosyltransferase [Gemmatimonadaceae bacterium]|nr:glycosyltransferase [Gemmatimonadaceae bacterium]
MTDRRLIVVDPHLKDMVGHYFAYDYSLMQAARARGYDFVALGHERIDPAVASLMPVHAVFPWEIWHTFRTVQLIPRVGRRLETLVSNLLFYRQLRTALRRCGLSPDSLVFTHMITKKQLLAWAWWIRRLHREAGPRVALLLRYSAEWFKGSRVTTRAFRMIENAVPGVRVRICTDSERLAFDYAQFTRLAIDVVPIPHTRHSGKIEGRRRRESRGVLRLVSLGNARDEKGFVEILQAVRILSEWGRLDGFKFVLQANSADLQMQMAIQESEDLVKSGSVEFIFETLSPEAYHKLLCEADGVLLPYWRSIYRSRTSGVFVEALAAGKPVIATEDTWMSDQLKHFGGGLLCRDRDPKHLAERILDLESNYESYAERAVASRETWCERHNPEALMDSLLRQEQGRSRAKTKVAVLYPWNDIRRPQSGAGRRARLLVDYLSEHYHVNVLSADYLPPAAMGNVVFRSYPRALPTRILVRLARRACYLALRLITAGKSRGEEFMFWAHQSWRFERGLRRSIGEIASWADVVLLEYTFWAPPVLKACRRTGTEVIVTDYDVVSDQISGSLLLKELVRRAEMAAMRAADRAVCVSIRDWESFRRCGIDAEVIHHPIDRGGVPSCPLAGRVARQRLQDLTSFDLSNRCVCLFVGSYFGANLVAVQRIREISRRLLVEWGEVAPVFIVAGACCAPVQDHNFIAIGPVDDELLRDLYVGADLVVAPIPFGTGASVKVLEAMAYGKVVIGTSVAFRGYSVVPGVHCVVVDDLDSYPTEIVALLNDRVRSEALSEKARAFAEAFDYRAVCRRYRELIDGLTGGQG